MIRLSTHLAVRQAGYAARSILACGAVALAVGSLPAGIGLFAEDGLHSILLLTALVAPLALALAAPLALVVHLGALVDSGEWSALAGAGLRPATIAIALSLPWLPIALAFPSLVHEACPAARRALTDRALLALRADPMQALGSIPSEGVAIARTPGPWRALIGIGDAALALELSAPGGGAPEPAGRLGPGRAAWLSGDAVRRATFSGATITAGELDRPLALHSERELSTSFLLTGGVRFARARGNQGLGPGGALVRRELARRRAEIVTFLLAIVLALLPLVRRTPPSRLQLRGFVLLGTVALAALAPRWLAMVFAGGGS